MSSIPRISIVISLYYNSPLLYRVISRCFGSIERYWRQGHQIIVVDDASPLEIPEYWPITSHNEENKGFTATVNEGLKLANGDIIVVMNDDIEMTEECFDRFLHLDPLSPTIASPADTSSSPDDRFGACWGITRAAYELLGPLNEDYKHFYSDIDYYERAKAAQVPIIKWPDIVLDHPESSTYKLLDKDTLLKEDQERYHNNR